MSPKVDPLALSEMGSEMDSIAQRLGTGELGFEQAVLEYSTREETKNQGGLVVNPRDGGTLFGSDEIDPNLFSSSMLFNPENPQTPSNSPMTTIKATGLRCSWKSASRRTERTQRRILGTSKPSSKTVCAKNR